MEVVGGSGHGQGIGGVIECVAAVVVGGRAVAEYVGFGGRG